MTKSEKLRTAFKLHTAGVQMKRLQLKRRNPTLTPQELDQLYQEWLRSSQSESASYIKRKSQA